MNKKKRLTVANKWNQPLFAKGVDRENNHIFDIAGLAPVISRTDPRIFSTPDSSLFLRNNGVDFVGMNPFSKPWFSYDKGISMPPLPAVPTTFGLSNVSLPNVSDAAKAQVSSLPQLSTVKTPPTGIPVKTPFFKTAMGNQLLGMGADVASNILYKGVSNGYSSDIGNGISLVGNTVSNFLPGPWKYVGKIGSGILGGVANTLLGTKEDPAKIAAVENSIASKNATGKMLASSLTNDAVLSASNAMSGHSGIKSNEMVKRGLWNKSTKGIDLANRENLALAGMVNGLAIGANKADRNLDNSAIKYTAAFGGPLDMLTNNDMGSATTYGFLSDLTQKNSKNNNTTGNMFAGYPKSFFANGGIAIKKKNRGKFTAQAKAAGMGTQEYATHVLANKEDYPKETVLRANFAKNAAHWNALGGDLQTHGGDFSTGATHISAGGQHEENPYDGVQLGIAPDGKPNLVEEGEVVYNQYVYSQRIELDEEAKAKFHFAKKADLSYADAAKKLEKEIEERPNDPISQAAFERQMADLAEEQERQKQEMDAQKAQEAFEALTPEEQIELIQYAQQQQSQEEAISEEEAMAQEQAMAEQQAAQEQAMQQQGMMQQPMGIEQAMMAQQMPPEAMQYQGMPMMAYGGNLYSNGGHLFRWGGNTFSGNKPNYNPDFELLKRNVSNWVNSNVKLKGFNTTQKNAFANVFARIIYHNKNLYYKKPLGRIGAQGKWDIEKAYKDVSPLQTFSENELLRRSNLLIKSGLDRDTALSFFQDAISRVANDKGSKNYESEARRLSNLIAKGVNTDGYVVEELTVTGNKQKNPPLKSQNESSTLEKQITNKPISNVSQAQKVTTQNNAEIQRVQAPKESTTTTQTQPAAQNKNNSQSSTKPTTPVGGERQKRRGMNAGSWIKGDSSSNWSNYSRVGLKNYLQGVVDNINAAPDEATKNAIRQEAISTIANIQNAYKNAYQDTLSPTDFRDAVTTLQTTFQNAGGNAGFDNITSNIKVPNGALNKDIASNKYTDGLWGPRTSIRNWGSTEYGIGDEEYYKDISDLATQAGLKYAPNAEWTYGNSENPYQLYGLSLLNEEAPADQATTNPSTGKEIHFIDGYDGEEIPDSEVSKYGPETRRVTLDNGDIAIYHANPDKDETVAVNDNAKKSKGRAVYPILRDESLRGMGVFGPVTALVMQGMGIGRPDYSDMNRAVAMAGDVGYFPSARYSDGYYEYKPINPFLGDIAANNASAGVDRSISNISAPYGNIQAARLANSYNDQMARADRIIKGNIYNNGERKTSLDEYKNTDQFNANAFNTMENIRAQLANGTRQRQAYMAMNAAQQKLAGDAEWNNALYQNVQGVYKGLSDLYKENAMHNMIARLAATGALGEMSPENAVGAGLLTYADEESETNRKRRLGKRGLLLG